ncbi:hypothetical protein PAXRUDRAFT_830326 [Paxillus rubicundulus Ve08.2h10]|uniref:Uncharacterized protein n=1 Tax=Paxillus rubicundulus Ve08.2h10 TaxID=930991 RepID=A0A0D0E4A4_9AGAM|nr:hypothetical protein PAXRUDRAFT_830326 [Paxillus rubicundulus Ve08.2h10]
MSPTVIYQLSLGPPFMVSVLCPLPWLQHEFPHMDLCSTVGQQTPGVLLLQAASSFQWSQLVPPHSQTSYQTPIASSLPVFDREAVI